MSGYAADVLLLNITYFALPKNMSYQSITEIGLLFAF